MEFIVITGLSGSGKTQTADFLEDSGFYTVDNIPPEFMPRFAEFCLQSGGRYDRVAMISDVRAGDDFSLLLSALAELARMDCPCRLLFLEADLPVIIRRYKETRRIHPLAVEGRSLEEAALQERELLRPVRDRADWILDTTPFTSSGQLRSALVKLFNGENFDGDTGLTVNVMSFGYKYGLPLEADLVLDTRFLPNPYYVARLKALTGQNAAVRDYLNSFQVTGQFLDRLDALMAFLLPHFAEEGRRAVTIAVGCTGGRHRSVAVADALAERLRTLGYAVNVSHRDIAR